MLPVYDSSLDTLIVARPHKGYWFPTSIFALLGLLAGFVLPQVRWDAPEPRCLIIALFASPFFAIATGYALWICRARVIADEFGLRWRSIGRWRHAQWEEITDYYERGLPDKSSRRRIVETSAGKLDLSAELDRRDALYATIAARAVCARARSWGERGIRPEDDWPRTFRYDTPDSWFLPWLLGGYLAGAVAVTVLLAIPKTLEFAHDLGWPLALCAGLLMATVFTGMPMTMALALVPVLTETQRRNGQTLSADLQGLQYRSPQGEIRVRWDEVQEYYFGPSTGWIKGQGPAVVVTSGGTFDFLHTLQDARQLRAIIQHYATHAATQEWCGDEHERLGGEKACWTGGSAGVGQRVYHYRTRMNRALLGLPGAYWLAWVVSTVVGPLRDRLVTGPAVVLGPGIVLTAAMLWLIWRYHQAAVLVDERGITQRAWNGARFIAWTEVEDVSIRGEEGFRFGTVAGGGRRVRFWLGIADVDELLDTLARYAPGARRMRWENRALD